jgi:hypothetical protein
MRLHQQLRRQSQHLCLCGGYVHVPGDQILLPLLLCTSCSCLGLEKVSDISNADPKNEMLTKEP